MFVSTFYMFLEPHGILFTCRNNSYLMEEWKVRHKDASEDLSSKFLTLRFMQLEVLHLSLDFRIELYRNIPCTLLLAAWVL